MDRDFLIDLFSDFGPVTIRRMFSGYGISADGTNFALALRAGLYFRADEETIPQFEAEGSKPFQYQTRAKTVTVNHRSCRGNGDIFSICRQSRTDLETGGKAAGRAVSHEPKRHRQAEQQQAHR